MVARANAGRRLAALSAVLIVSGCGVWPGSAPAIPVESATPAPASPSTTTSAARPTVAPYGPVTIVAGTETCSAAGWAPTTDPDGTWHRGSREVACTDEADDPRVSGSLTVDARTAGSEDTHDSAVVQWGNARLTSTGGAWVGLASGVNSSDRGDTIVIWYKGTGDYVGLSYFELINGDAPWTVRGQIVPGDPPFPYATGPHDWGVWSTWPDVETGSATLVTGTAVCPGMSWDWTIDPDGTRHVRDDYHPDRCAITTDDPRVSGSRTSTWNIDLWGSPADSWALAQWGAQRLENDDGEWEGFATGIASAWAGDVIVNWYKGGGAYAGLGYFELWTGSDPWAIQGQIFPGDPPTP